MDLKRVKQLDNEQEPPMSEAMEFYEMKNDGMSRQERRAYLRMVAKMNKKAAKRR